MASIPAQFGIKQIKVGLPHSAVFQVFSHLNYIFFNLTAVQKSVMVLMGNNIL
jgi:hypothetical protein